MNYCFKWLLILFKREFSYDDIKVLWEALWSDVVPKNFHLLVAASIFYGEMDKIMQTCEDVNQLLQVRTATALVVIGSENLLELVYTPFIIYARMK
ncbi:unnamed protein product [Dibothriocephalus latus]|uniref:Rab-GAP TBC domain-containing protein n=1 Tax=Dibothriocephalus latus TaxID=60516 RepID=A0A3P7N310_DIBLA|nr:unnamed protein product [Dibothriocephalus latus]